MNGHDDFEPKHESSPTDHVLNELQLHGYRPFAEVNDGSGHKSTHGEGRALDISILRVPNEKLFEVCRELKDVACGFYPNSKFVHLGVRRAHTGKTFWIDESMPGEPANRQTSRIPISRRAEYCHMVMPAP